MKIKFCCEKFADRFSHNLNRPSAIVKDQGKWYVNGCCGGGCFVISNMKFCPWCGTKLEDKNAD